MLGRVIVGNNLNIRNECLFSGFTGDESERGTNTSSENRFAVHAICFVPRSDAFPMSPNLNLVILIPKKSPIKVKVF